FDAGRHGLRAADGVGDAGCFGGGVGGGGDPAVFGGQGVEPEDRFGDDAEGAEGSGVDLAEVVSGDVLDDLSAGFGDGAVGAHHGDADEQVADAAEEVALRPGQAGGDGAADGGGGEWLADGQLLPGLFDGAVDLGQRGAGFGVHHQVACGVFDDAAAGRQVQQQVDRSGWGSPVEFAAGALGDHAQAVFAGGAQHRGDLLGVAGSGAPLRLDAADRVGFRCFSQVFLARGSFQGCAGGAGCRDHQN